MEYKYGDIVKTSNQIDSETPYIFIHEMEPSIRNLATEVPPTFCMLVALDNTFSLSVAKSSLSLIISAEKILPGILMILNRRVVHPCQRVT